MSLRVGIDVGGTFTDVTVLDEDTGQIREVRKVPSNPAAPLDVLDGVLADMRAKWGPEALSYLLHGSTHALNTVLEEKGSRTGLLTTQGFRDVYEIARQWKGEEVFNIFYPGGKRFVPRRRIAEVPERLDKSGDVLVPLDPDALDEAVAGLMEQGIDALAVAFLFSYVNPAHERLAAEHIRSRYPDLFVSLSSEVNPVWREYERTATTVLNAYLGPRMEQYFAGMEETVLRHFPRAHPFLMKSNGGIGAPKAMARFPVQTLMSGPVAGVVAAHELGARTGASNLISLDIGGTSSDMSLIPGRPLFRTEWQIGRHPVRVDSVEVESLGAGGGSLAQVRYGRVLQVGPQSAGAVPGPACYMRGGDQPTLTDALGATAPPESPDAAAGRDAHRCGAVGRRRPARRGGAAGHVRGRGGPGDPARAGGQHRLLHAHHHHRAGVQSRGLRPGSFRRHGTDAGHRGGLFPGHRPHPDPRGPGQLQRLRHAAVRPALGRRHHPGGGPHPGLP